MFSYLQVKGELFEKKSMLERNYSALVKFAKSEGYTQDQIDFHHSAQELKNFNLIQKGAARLILNSSNLTSVIKSYNSWREYTNLRKRIKYYSQFVLNHLRKGDLANSFLRWRNFAKDCKEEENTMTKSALITKYSHNDPINEIE
jgi:hypothetical protein